MSTTATPMRKTVSTNAAEQTRKGSGPVIVAVGREDVHHLLTAGNALATRLGTSVRVISVVPPILVSGMSGAPIYVPAAEAEMDVRDSIAHMVEREVTRVAGQAPGTSWEVVDGDAAAVLTERASSLRASMLLMGLGRHRAVEQLLAAETTLRVMRHCSAPVLAVNADFDGAPKRAVVATDFSARSALAAQAAIPLLAEGATLHLVHVWQPSGSRAPSIVAAEKRYADSLAERFARLRSVLTVPSGVTVTTSAIEGNVVERVLDFAETTDADLLVAGRQGLSFLTRLMVGSVTTALVRGARCPVLIIPEPSYPAA
jgi:nucleotide-binding universal stress UspA family protein